MNFSKSYLQTLRNVLLFSKISSFVIAILTFLNIFEILYFSIFHHNRDWINEKRNVIFISISFQLIISVIFTLRFIFLWFKKNNNFIWFSQISWLIGWLTILSYQLVTAKVLFGSFTKVLFGSFIGSRQDCMDCFYSDTFLWLFSDYLVLLFLAYLFLSPIKQILILLLALLSPKTKL
jgi:hypothetical protein